MNLNDSDKESYTSVPARNMNVLVGAKVKAPGTLNDTDTTSFAGSPVGKNCIFL